MTSRKEYNEMLDEWWNKKGKAKWDQTWQNMRKRGDVSCHGCSIPSECDNNGECDTYPAVPLCIRCNPCPCRFIKRT